uniref:Ig-like domain-containing protein n=1 Tax=Chelonoidis abingdonii TaxID=106734 RepID=A0A8C0J0G5_CHEAB
MTCYIEYIAKGESLTSDYCVHVFVFLFLVTASQEGISIQQSLAQIFLASGKTAEIHCKLSTRRQYVFWYKELQNGSLHWIYQSYEFATPPHEKYSSKVNSQTNTFTLIISNVQRNDSGVYYCGLAVYVHPNFGTGTRLIVTGEFPVGNIFYWTNSVGERNKSQLLRALLQACVALQLVSFTNGSGFNKRYDSTHLASLISWDQHSHGIKL